MKLGDVAREVKITINNPLEEGLERYVGLEHLDPQELKIQRWGNIADGVTFNKKFCAGQILFGRRRAYQKKAAVADFDGICSGDITVIEAIEGAIVPELLPYIIQSDSFFEYAVSESAGSLSPRVKWKHLAEYELSLPDENTQRKIAELMQAFDKSIETKKHLLNCLLETKLALIIESSSLGSNLKLKDVFELRRELIEDNDAKTHYVALEHMESSTGRLIGLGKASDAISIKTKFYPKDILFGKLRPYLRKYWLANIEGVCSTEILVLKCKNNCLPEYGYFLVQNERFIRYTIHNSFGTKMPRASWEKMCDYDIKLPSIDEQKKLVRKLNAVETNIFSVLESIDATNELKKAAITKLITGGETQ